MNKYVIGSYIWFSIYQDYIVHDKDVLCVCDIQKQIIFKKKGYDLIMMPRKTSKEYVDEILESGINRSTSLYCGKFLCPQFAKDFGVTMKDLETIKPYIYATDEKHQYQRVILDYYLLNGDFVLTNEQRDQAYKVYKDARKKLYHH